MSRPRTILIVVGALALLLALTPFIPRGGDDDGALRPSGDGKADELGTADTAGLSKVTPAMQTEIDRVVAAGRRVGRTDSKAGAIRSGDLVRCAELDGQRYCLGGVGWTEDSEQQVRARVLRAARTSARTTSARLNTGDLDAAALLQRAARMSPTARARQERAELTMAARSVAKVWLLRHDLEGTALPTDFLARHPEARAATTAARAAATPTATPTKAAGTTPVVATSTKATAKATATATPAATTKKAKTRKDYPMRSTILSTKRVHEQLMTYWCGPGSMQMIAWNWSGKPARQQTWAKLLGTTRSGTSITDMVRVVNRYTGWDGTKYAGPYVTLDIGSWSYERWFTLMMRHIHDYKAPVVLHPILLKKYYPYLDDNASGHYQVGRGYDRNGSKPDLLGYFEPWNQQRFDPSEPYISRVQWRSAYRSYRANKAHFLHNVGV